MRTTNAFIFIIALILLAACGPGRLTSPPDEFYGFVDSTPIESDATMLGEWSYLYQEEDTICTGFVNDRLYGVDAPFTDVISHFEAALKDDGIHYIKTERAGHHEYLFSELGLMVVSPVVDEGMIAAAKYQFGEETLTAAFDTFDTVYAISVEHRYGKCEPHPGWSD